MVVVTIRLQNVQPKKSRMTSGKAISPWKLREKNMRTNAKSQPPVRGRWVENKTMWYEQTMFYCDCCGMLIPQMQFVVEDKGSTHRFCGADCAKLNQQLKSLNKRLSSTKS